MKKAILIIMPLLAAVAIGLVVLKMKADNSAHLKTTYKNGEIKVQEADAIYVNCIDELQNYESFKNIKFRVSAGKLAFPTEHADIKADMLEIESNGRILLSFTGQKWLKDEFVGLHAISCTIQDMLNCHCALNSEGELGVFSINQDKPSGMMNLMHKKNGRWGGFMYGPWLNKGDSAKRDFYDKYIDIDFDGYLDVRFVFDSQSEKIIKRYIMLGMDWQVMDRVAVDQDVPEAFTKEGWAYVFVGDCWQKAENK